MPTEDEGILNLQRAWLDKLQAISKRPITIKAIEGATPEGCADPDLYRWMFYKDVWGRVQEPIWTRRILDNEIVFDPDVKNWQVLREEMNKLVSFCRSKEIPFDLSYTGGNGVHLSIYIKPIELDAKLLNEAQERDIDISKLIRQLAVNYLLISSGADAKKLMLDTKKFNFSKMRSGSQLREYGTPREKGGYKTLIDDIPESKPKSLPLRFPDEVELWDASCISTRIDLAIKEEIDLAARNNYTNIDPIVLTDCKINSFPCIKTLLDKGRASSRYYGGQGIALMMKKCGYTWESTEPVILKYFKKCTGLTKADIDKRLADVKNTVTEYDYHFSCREFKEIFGKEYCKFSKCPISEKIDKAKTEAKIKESVNADKSDEDKSAEAILLKAKEIMEKEDPVQFILSAHQKIHVGDDNLARSLLVSIGCQSVENSDGIHPKVSGESGKGKTHCCRAMAHLIPDEWRCETTLSDKVIYYINIKPGSVIFSDDVALSEALEGVIKRSTSNYQKGDTHTTLDAQRNLMKLTVPPRITWWLTSVDDNQSMQLLNRQFGGGVDDSTEQDKKVMDFQIIQAIEGEVSLPETFEVLVCREILRQVKSQLFKIKIPYLRGLKWYDIENRRNLPIFLDIIKAFAVLRFKQRPIIDGFLIALLQDFEDARNLYCSRAENQKLKLSDTERKICEFLRDNGESDSKSICRAVSITLGRLTQIMSGKDGQSGLLDKFKGLSVEKISVKDNDTTTHKNVYMLDGFNLFESLGYVVELGHEGIDDFTRLYPTFTSTFTNIHTHIYNTTTTGISKKVNQDLPNSQNNTAIKNSKNSVLENNKKNSLALRTVKVGLKVNSEDATTDSHKLNVDKSGGKYGSVQGSQKLEKPKPDCGDFIKNQLTSYAQQFPDGMLESLIVGVAPAWRLGEIEVQVEIDKMVEAGKIIILRSSGGKRYLRLK